jgi:hypothetical protein
MKLSYHSYIHIKLSSSLSKQPKDILHLKICVWLIKCVGLISVISIYDYMNISYLLMVVKLNIR